MSPVFVVGAEQGELWNHWETNGSQVHRVEIFNHTASIADDIWKSRKVDYTGKSIKINVITDQMSSKWLNKTTKASFWPDIDSDEVCFDTSEICYEDSESCRMQKIYFHECVLPFGTHWDRKLQNPSNALLS